MGHEHLARAVGELRQRRPTPSSADRALPHAPTTCEGVEVGPTVGGEDRAAQCGMRVGESRRERGRPVAPAPVDAHPPCRPGVPAGGHHVMHILAPRLRINLRDALLAACGGPLLDGVTPAQPHAAGDAAPGASLPPRLAGEGLLTCALARAQRPRRQACALRLPPPAGTGQGQAPAERCGFIEPKELPPARPGRAGGTCQRARGERSRGGCPAPRGPRSAALLVLHPPRPLSRPRCPPACWAPTAARARHRPGAERAPGGTGA
jgi:hypothetical protein